MRARVASLLTWAVLPLMNIAYASDSAARLSSCDGLPRLPVPTAPGFCLGLIADGLKAPRGLQPLPGGAILVSDMGGWQADRGRVWMLRPEAGRYKKTLLFEKLDRPNSIALGPDGLVYLGMVKRVVRFDPRLEKPALTDVIGGNSGIASLPAIGRHVLPALLFDAAGNLFVNIGSASDHCEGQDGTMPAGASCSEREGANAVGVIRKYTLKWPGGTVRSWEVYARGLRNSMAMVFDPRSGALWQAENARDGMNAAMPGLKNDDESPHDELNLIERGADYGWPYCYDNNLASPEYPAARCAGYRLPRRLLPAHAAPLGMAFYTGDAFPAKFHNSLIVSFHGYRRYGHRVVALLADRSGAPMGQSVDLVIGARRTGKGLGAPVGVKVGADGNVYLTDDRDGFVARLHYEGSAR
jgi:glucose/arabinose dehydrogenase